MSVTLSRYLKDFSAEPPPSSGMADMPFEEMSIFPESPVEPPVDIEAERRDAYAQGHEAATQELTQRHQAELETIAEAHPRRDRTHCAPDTRIARRKRLPPDLRRLADRCSGRRSARRRPLRLRRS